MSLLEKCLPYREFSFRQPSEIWPEPANNNLTEDVCLAGPRRGGGGEGGGRGGMSTLREFTVLENEEKFS